MKTNVLYYGDNLDILRHHIPDESIDLIYLDPPFNSQATYNVLFREESGAVSHAQIEAFEDTWHWGEATAQAYDEVIRGREQRVARILKAMVDGLGHNQVTAYLTMMAIRLVELHRVLATSGTIYLHCDPTASHYLKLIMDSAFGPKCFRNEIVWERFGSHNDPKRFGRVTDTILFYTKSENYQFHAIRGEYSQAHLSKRFRYADPDGRRFWPNTMLAPGGRGPSYEWHGHTRNWRFTKENMAALDARGEIYYSAKGMPYRKNYLDELAGQLVQNLWSDIKMTKSGKERLGYQTQKPLALLERIIAASSSPGDIVLDPFCGCGTAVHAAQKLGRQWIGIDITHLAIGLIRRRMQDAFPGIEIEVIGEPVDLTGARELAGKDKYQFQWWALDKLGAQPVAGKKKGSDKGIDGVIPFFGGPKEDYKRAIVSVKGGEHAGVLAVRDLKGVLDREKEPIGILLALNPPTKDMITEAAASGFYENDFWKKKYPRVQIITVLDLLKGKRPEMPWGGSPFARAPTEKERAEQEAML
jgi:site-specific DNA-methyltransferase (adenine-specific)